MSRGDAGQHGSARSMSFNLGDGPANALALSKDNSHVVVAGRNVFKILSIEEDCFIEKVNLRVGKHLNLNYSCNDVVWSTLDENVIATGATNGAVVLWNLSKITRAKQEHVFADHQRTVHKVVFHPTDPFMLLSGSQDGTVKCFDLRVREAKLTFKSNSESVRDVQFLPKNNFSFTSVSENGNVQLWDVRKGGERPFLTFTAHSGPVFSCDWHPELPNVLATGGRDRAIKVWAVTNNIATLEHTIQTVASVGRVKWRPQRKNHIGSTSLVVDASVCVWDVRRPFVPFAAFEKHKDVATGIVWKSSPHIFLSTSKDCTVWQNIFKDAMRPASKAMPQALALNIRRGEIAQAITTYQSDTTASPRFPIFNRKSTSLDEQFHMAKSLFFTFEAGRLLRDGFRVECAERYVLSGRSPQELCEINANIALSLNLKSVGLVWEIAKLFLTTRIIEPTPHVETTKVTVPTPNHVSQAPPKPKEEHEDHVSDDEQNHSSSEVENQDVLGEIASGLHMTQNLFMPAGPTYEFQISQDGPVLPAEAFQHRHEIREGSPPLHLEDCSPRDIDEAIETVAVENRTSYLKFKFVDPVPAFDFSEPLTKALHFHAKEGDVQTAVCVWLVLSPVYKLPIERRVLEAWCYGYTDLLKRNRLYAQAAAVIKHCGVLGHLSQESTSYLICCGKCGKPLTQKAGNFCDKYATNNLEFGCRKAVARCGVCHMTVTGLMSWCQGCGHGGHVEHLHKWFSRHKECPVGCGHVCHS